MRYFLIKFNFESNKNECVETLERNEQGERKKVRNGNKKNENEVENNAKQSQSQKSLIIFSAGREPLFLYHIELFHGLAIRKLWHITTTSFTIHRIQHHILH